MLLILNPQALMNDVTLKYGSKTEYLRTRKIRMLNLLGPALWLRALVGKAQTGKTPSAFYALCSNSITTGKFNQV